MAREIMVTIMEITKIKNKFTKAIVNWKSRGRIKSEIFKIKSNDGKSSAARSFRESRVWWKRFMGMLYEDHS